MPWPFRYWFEVHRTHCWVAATNPTATPSLTSSTQPFAVQTAVFMPPMQRENPGLQPVAAHWVVQIDAAD